MGCKRRDPAQTDSRRTVTLDHLWSEGPPNERRIEGCLENEMKRKIPRCGAEGCSELAYSEGLCNVHLDEKGRKEKLHAQAVRALDCGEVDGAVLDDKSLRNDLEQLSDRWRLVCNVVNSQRGTNTFPLAHAQFAVEWCISFAEQIIEAQRSITAGTPVGGSYEHTKRWVWERLRGLEREPGQQ
jgi:hypothetical protein